MAAYFDFLVHPNFFIGVAPQYIFNVKGEDGNGSAAKELDLQVRLGAQAPVADKFTCTATCHPATGSSCRRRAAARRV